MWAEWDIRVLSWDISVLLWVDFAVFGKTALYLSAITSRG